MNGSISILTRLERFTMPHLLILTNKPTINYINSILIGFSAILLMLPLPVPLTDFLPAYGILLLAVGILECDGYLLLVSYLMVVITTIYFSLITVLGLNAIITILSCLGLNFQIIK